MTEDKSWGSMSASVAECSCVARACVPAMRRWPVVAVSSARPGVALAVAAG